MLTPDQPPPADYYQNNCRTLAAFVLREYRDVMQPSLYAELTAFNTLGDDEQHLLARLLTRKGPLIRVDSLDYREVDDVDASLRRLQAAGFVTIDADVAADLPLNLMRKGEIVEAFGQLGAGAGRLRKPELIEQVLSRYSDARILSACRPALHWVMLANPELWRMVRLLYFGDTEHDWSAFVVRDLGVMQYETVTLENRRFASAEDLHADLGSRQLNHLSKRLDEHPGLWQELCAALCEPCDDRFIESRRRRALLRMGRWLERQQDMPGAIQAYQSVGAHPSRERIVRLLSRMGEADQAQCQLEQIRQSPWCEEERQFALRFGKRAAGFQPPQTELLIDQAEAAIHQT